MPIPKKEREMAYQAGRAAYAEPPERRSPDSCPFPVESEEREAWLDGFGDAIDETPPVADLKAQLKEARAK